MLAKIQGLFRLTRDCEIRYLSDGKPVAKLGLACSEKYGDKETQLFIDATIWGKQAETFNQYAGRKGTQVFIVGKIHTEEWIDQQTQQKRSKISMVVESFDFVSNKSGNDSSSQQQSYSQPQQQQQSQSYQAPSQQQPARQMPSSNEVPVIDEDIDDIPF